VGGQFLCVFTKERSVAVPIQGAYYDWEYGYGGDSGGQGSLQINFPPSNALALTSLSTADGDGLCGTGFAQYRSRNPDGSDTDHNFSWTTDFGFPPMARDANMTSVTAELVLGANQQGVMTLLVWFL
jgi:hypothetical protein